MEYQKTAIKQLVDELDERYVRSVLLFVSALAKNEVETSEVARAS